MVILRRTLAPIAILAAGLGANPAQAQMRPSSPAAIAAAVGDCWQAVNATIVDEAGLRAKGWTAGSFRSPDGKAVASQMTIYSKAGSNVLLMIDKKIDPRGCMITSKVDTLSDISTTAQAIHQQLKAIDPKVEGKKPSPSQVAYFSLPKAALLRATGSKESPGTIIQVSYHPPEKK